MKNPPGLRWAGGVKVVNQPIQGIPAGSDTSAPARMARQGFATAADIKKPAGQALGGWCGGLDAPGDSMECLVTSFPRLAYMYHGAAGASRGL